MYTNSHHSVQSTREMPVDRTVTVMMSGDVNRSIRMCVEEVSRCLKGRFILIGGAAMLLLGSDRSTSDVDILVSANEDRPALIRLLVDHGSFLIVGGELHFRAAEMITVDILATAVESVTFENVQSHLLTLGDINVPNLEYALAMKIKTFYSRQDDDNGMKKRQGDIRDVGFLCTKMMEHMQTVSDKCVEAFQFGCYHMLELRRELSPEALENFIKIGGRKLILPWAKNTPEQQEYFVCFAEAGSDPLTVELQEE